MPGEQVVCACPGGDRGVQVCGPSGDVFEPCQCDTGPVPGTEGGTGSSGSSGEASTSEVDETADGPICGDGIADPNECPDACPSDCPSGGSTGQPICKSFVGLVEDQPSVWQEQGAVGFEAGQLKCAGIGADHVCDYVELAAAADNGELMTLTAGTTVWLHRTTPAMLEGVTYSADLGGRCVDWTYGTNHLSDGEYLEIGVDGPTFHLDSDPFYDGIDPSHAVPDELQCGDTLRSIPCCNQPC